MYLPLSIVHVFDIMRGVCGGGGGLLFDIMKGGGVGGSNYLKEELMVIKAFC